MAHSPQEGPTEDVEAKPRATAGADPDKRKRLLSAAIRTFGRRGFHEARISEIAAAAKVAEGTVYLYFKNKEDLLGSVFDETMDDVLAKARDIRSAVEPVPDRLRKLVALHISFLASDRDLASVFQIELRRSARLVERFSRSKLVEYLRMLEGLLKEGIGGGELRADLDPRLAVRIIFGTADEIVSDWLLSGEAQPYASGERLVDTLLAGFGPAVLPKKSVPKKKRSSR
jgi:TetR/AcrR family fatty acid metabolism transcriptional regulator